MGFKQKVLRREKTGRFTWMASCGCFYETDRSSRGIYTWDWEMLCWREVVSPEKFQMPSDRRTALALLRELGYELAEEEISEIFP